jgi:hypothetical protein
LKQKKQEQCNKKPLAVVKVVAPAVEVEVVPAPEVLVVPVALRLRQQ